MKPRVYAVRCSDYNQVDEKLGELLALMGGIETYLTPGTRTALKVNLLSAAAPEKAVTTHPAVAGAVGAAVKAAGGDPLLIDSPTGAYSHSRSTFERLYRETGMAEAAARAGLDLNYDTEHRPVSSPQGKMIKSFEVMTPLLEAGSIINLPKFKTHSLMIMTGAVKNCFGAIPGRIKPGYHAKLPDRSHFARMLLDLAAFVDPRLTIMDAVVGMEGDGPGSGDPRPVGLLLGAENTLALDVVVGEMMGLAGEDNPLLVEAEKQGRSPTRLEEIELVGIDRGQLRISGFKLPSTHSPMSGLQETAWWRTLIAPLIKSGLTLEPRVIEDACVACGDCVTICPEGVIGIEGDEHPYAWIDEEGCIRCYCCHETCPQDAIELHKSLMYRLVMG